VTLEEGKEGMVEESSPAMILDVGVAVLEEVGKNKGVQETEKKDQEDNVYGGGN
jgi:hypothetical protein